MREADRPHVGGMHRIHQRGRGLRHIAADFHRLAEVHVGIGAGRDLIGQARGDRGGESTGLQVLDILGIDRGFGVLVAELPEERSLRGNVRARPTLSIAEDADKRIDTRRSPMSWPYGRVKRGKPSDPSPRPGRTLPYAPRRYRTYRNACRRPRSRTR